MKKRAIIALAGILGCLYTVTMALPPPLSVLRYYGHACFVLTTISGTRIVMDPHSKLNYPLPQEEAHIVTVSHEHFDHNNTKAIKGKPVVLRGLNPQGGWNDIERDIKDVRIRNVGVYHDDEKGLKRGLNSIFIFEFDSIKLAHAGDLGHKLSEETIKKIGKIDILLVPVGGYFTIDAIEAWQVAGQLAPKVIVPMHYRTGKTKNLPIQPIDSFLKGGENERHISRGDPPGRPYHISLPMDRQEVWVFPTP